jgi:hypothetical protein
MPKPTPRRELLERREVVDERVCELGEAGRVLGRDASEREARR